ncbi:hypothetical protein K3495_g4931 [Podosphaera aphanis]|nr:hypothetical protein K3495_g4931 [Podosphaera aphanis]
MAVREEIVSSAVTFLQDADVAASPIEKRIAFLQSKKLTGEEIELALARASGGISSRNYSSYAPSQHATQQSQPLYGQYLLPPPPKRDWKDLFIMATVMGGVGYGIYTIAKRYIYPIIAPPTTPQLEQDKQAISDSFDDAFALLDKLAKDTAELKSSEQARTERLDSALSEVETVISDVKNSSRRREEESRRITDEVHGLRNLIPKAIEGQKENVDSRLKELNNELKSLKLLLSQRMNPGTLTSPSLNGRTHGFSNPNPVSITSTDVDAPLTTDVNDEKGEATSTNPTSSAVLAKASSGKTVAIPSWQLASNRNLSSPNSSGSQAISTG